MEPATQLEMLAQVFLALVLGATIGLEREYRGLEAGIRTNALVCAGAAMFGIASNDAGDSRIAAGVVQGIGFLGAGLIFQRGATVHNLTTAATVWASASIGLLVVVELWLVAAGAAVAIIAILELQPLSDCTGAGIVSPTAAGPSREQPRPNRDSGCLAPSGGPPVPALQAHVAVFMGARFAKHLAAEAAGTGDPSRDCTRRSGSSGSCIHTPADSSLGWSSRSPGRPYDDTAL